jgi:ATP-dependent Clp protease ATP-binding subunit ClpC
MTSNIGARQLKDFGTGVGFGTQSRKEQEQEMAKGVIESALKKAFAPEFLNRIDDVIMFNALSKEDISKIIDIELNGLFERVAKMGYKLNLTEAAKNFIIEKGYDPNYGARPLKRAIQKYIEDPLAEELLKHNVNEGDELELDYLKEEDRMVVNAVKQKSKKTKKDDKNPQN